MPTITNSRTRENILKIPKHTPLRDRDSMLKLILHPKAKAWVFSDGFCSHFIGRGFTSRSNIWTKLRSNTYILLTKHEGLTGRISARGLDSTDRAQRGRYKKDQGPIFCQDGP